ncbi:GAF domain-containing protein [uncultured Xylophilus sp.]|uniref:GAF domain-containing protein n=1 Tax=uncultured Xylophilus sp. TaxID=296832 RepID=UPI0025E7FD85|nr:GAF domain-containing protein [uncultured Xylophilus sp.]
MPHDSAPDAFDSRILALLRAQRSVLARIGDGGRLADALQFLAQAVEGDADGPHHVSFLLVDPDRRTLRLAAAPSLPAAYNAAADGFPIGPDGGSCGTAAHLGLPVYVEDIASDRRWAHYRDVALSFGLRACWSAPICDPRGTVLGTFATYYRAPRWPTADDIDAMALVVETAALAIERHDHHQALNASRAALALATDAAEVGIWDLDLRTDTLQWCARTKAMFGIAPGAPCSMADFYAGLHPADREATSAAFASAIDPAQRTIYDVEYRTVGRDDGVVRWVAARGRGVFDDEGRCIRALGTAIDITAHRAADAHQAFLLAFVDHLRPLSAPREIQAEAVRLLGRHLGASRVGYAEVGADGATAVLEVDHVDGVASLTGAYPTEAFGAGTVGALRAGLTAVATDATADLANAAACLADLDIRGMVAVPFLRDGRLRAALYVTQRVPRSWTREEVAVTEEVAARTWDALERARAEAALREESRALETLNHTGAMLAAELDLGSLVQRVVDACRELTGAAYGAFFYNVLNPAGEHLLLYTLSGAAPEAFAQFGMPRSTGVFAPLFRGEAAIRSDDITQDTRYGRFPPYHGMPPGHLPVRSYLAAPVISRSGEVIGGLLFGHPSPGVFTPRAERLATGMAAQAAVAIDNARMFQAAQCDRDTLEQRVAERSAELQLAHEQLRQSQKMEAVGQLTGGIAHDFNNLLQGITGSLEIVRRRVDQGRTDDLPRFIAGAMASAQRAASLTHRLLAFSRRQPLDPKPVRANPLVVSMEELLHRTLGERIGLELRLADDLWPTLCDPHQLESAILNLCINARDAMPDGGRLVVATGNQEVDAGEAARLGEIAPGPYVCIAVTDSGFGMSPDVCARAFEPFFTTKPLGQGTGLGLSMIYGFARQSEGHARIDSAPGAGTTVRLYLPRHRGDAPDDALPAVVPADEHRAAPAETVLVVEDEAVVRGLIVEVLAGLGYRALEAADGPSGLALLQSPQRIDLLVTDIGLPGLNGRQMADAARLLRPALPVLFMTGYAETAALAGGFLDHGMELITKPFAMDALAGRLRAMMAAGGTGSAAATVAAP